MQPGTQNGRKLLVITSGVPPHQLGGTEIVSIGIAERLAEKGYDIRVIALAPAQASFPACGPLLPGMVPPLVLRQPLRLGDVKTAQQFGFCGATWWPCIEEYLGLWKPHVIHVHFSTGLHALLGWLLSVRFRVPWILTWHSLEHIPTRGGEITRSLCVAADGVTAVSSVFARAIEEQLRLGEGSVVAIPNAVEAPSVDPTALNSSKQVLGIGRMVEQKCWPDLVRALSLVREYVPDATLTIAGDGPALGGCRHLVQTLGLADAVVLPGKVDRGDIYPLIMRSRVVALVARDEALGVALIEGAACGRPLLGTLDGGIPEIIRDGKNGFLVNVGDIEQIASRLTLLLNDDELACTMGQASRQVYLEKFTWDAVLPKYERLMDRSIAQHSVMPHEDTEECFDVSFLACLGRTLNETPLDSGLAQAVHDAQTSATLRLAWGAWCQGESDRYKAEQLLRATFGRQPANSPLWPWVAGELASDECSESQDLSGFLQLVASACVDDSDEQTLLQKLLLAASHVKACEGQRHSALHLAWRAFLVRPSRTALAVLVERLAGNLGPRRKT